MLDVRRLRALHALGQRGTIAAAADALDLTPSAVSQQLAALEREVGRPLVEPDGRTVRLTPAGRLVLDHADTLFAQLERLDADLAAHEEVGGLVRVGAFATALRSLVVPAIEALRETAPDVTIEGSELEAPEAFDRLARRELDLVISMEHEGAPRHDDPRLHRRDLLVDVLDLALPAGHPLAGDAEVELAGARDEAWILPPAGGCATRSPRPAA
jgi:DNA-binding transcriptional LysR family regulator